MRIFVTGITGFLGRHLAAELLARGHAVAGSALEAAPAPEGVELHAVALSETRELQRLVRAFAPDRVVHLAGLAHVGHSWERMAEYFRVNVLGTEAVLDAAGNVPVLLASSAEVYGVVPEEEQPIRESRHSHPTNPYAASKAAGEMAVLEAAHAHGTHAVIARSFNHTGPGQDARFALAAFARQLAAIRAGAAPPVLRVGNLQARRDYLDVRDVARAYLTLLDAGAPGGVNNVSTGEPFTMAQLVETMVELSGTGARVEVDPERVRPLDVPHLSGDPSALRALGWAPELPLRRTLADLLAHELACAGGVYAAAPEAA